VGYTFSSTSTRIRTPRSVLVLPMSCTINPTPNLLPGAPPLEGQGVLLPAFSEECHDPSNFCHAVRFGARKRKWYKCTGPKSRVTLVGGNSYGKSAKIGKMVQPADMAENRNRKWYRDRPAARGTTRGGNKTCERMMAAMPFLRARGPARAPARLSGTTRGGPLEATRSRRRRRPLERAAAKKWLDV